MKQKNNHARAKRRIKLLKLKNFCKRVIENRSAKMAKLNKPKASPLVGRVIPQISLVTRMKKRFYDKRPTNQRQKRKMWRQAPYMRKRA